jgi:hypothetical protein
MRPSRLTNDSTALAVGRMKSAGPCARHSSYEGNQSQKSKNLWLTEQTITEQVLMFQRLLAYTAETFAPLTERVFLNVVNGNHDEAQPTRTPTPATAGPTSRRGGLVYLLRSGDISHMSVV